MNDYSQEGGGKISLHGSGMGVPSPEDIERRAREIATIDERNPDEFTDADWAQARKELLGAEHPTPPEETKGSAEMSDDWEITAENGRLALALRKTKKRSARIWSTAALRKRPTIKCWKLAGKNSNRRAESLE